METQKKSLEELTLMDRFLFAEAMEDPENMKILLDIILGEDIVLKHLPQTEKELRKSSIDRMARIDVWAEDVYDRVYDTEVQRKNTGNLPKRSRFYKAMMDIKLLKSGENDFNKLNKVYIITIMPFDLFGKGLYKYTFVNTCEEVPGLALGDDAVRIFLNTKGTNEKDVSKELVQLLHYMEYTNDKDMELSDDSLKRLQNNVRELQKSAEVSVKFMQLWEELLESRNEGRAMGKAESILSFLKDLGDVGAELQDKIMSQKDLLVLDAWLKKAGKASSLDEFVQMMDE